MRGGGCAIRVHPARPRPSRPLHHTGRQGECAGAAERRWKREGQGWGLGAAASRGRRRGGQGREGWGGAGGEARPGCRRCRGPAGGRSVVRARGAGCCADLAVPCGAVPDPRRADLAAPRLAGPSGCGGQRSAGRRTLLAPGILLVCS